MTRGDSSYDYDPDLLYNIHQSRTSSSAPHCYIQPNRTHPKMAEVNQLAADIINTYISDKKPYSSYKKDGIINIRIRSVSGVSVVKVDWAELINHIRADRTFNPSLFGLPNLPLNWLDTGFTLANQYSPIIAVDNSRTMPFTTGTHFAAGSYISLTIDREGIFCSSTQSILATNITRLHHWLVQHSDSALDIATFTWFNNLRFLINECVSLVDTTLTQIYLRAQYHRPLPTGWSFDEARLGARCGRRISDKLKWVRLITRVDPLQNITPSLKHFSFIKNLRNHVNHFDPPCFCFVVEEVVEWLNKVPDVGRLILSIRKAAGLNVSVPIIELITLPQVSFVPADQTAQRLPMPKDFGYVSSTWHSFKPATIDDQQDSMT